MKLWGAAITAAFVLTGCHKPPPIYPDVCARWGRTFSDHEKITATLAYIHKHLEEPRLEYYRKIEVGRYAKKYQNLDSFVREYTAALPGCCEVYRPPSYTEWYSAQYGVGFSERNLIGNPGDWVADVAVENKSLGRNPRHRLWPDFKVSDCNEVAFIERG